jgi:hypothetical protein
MIGIILACSALVVASSSVQVRAQVDPASAQAAMDVLLAALRERDVEKLVSCFSKKRAFYLATTGQAVPQRARFTRAQLVRGMRPGGDFIDFMFGEYEADSLRDYASDGEWRALSANEFGLASDAEPHVIVSWVREGKRYVVSQIATPF